MPTPRHVTVICPLAHEARAIRRDVREIPDVRVLVSGPGPAAVERVLDALLNEPHANVCIILAGVAGELASAGPDPVVREVIDASGARFTPTFPPGSDGVTLLGLDAPVQTPADKRKWHERTGAFLVDTESHVVARRCTERGVAWAVVRCVSDSADETLPAQVLTWVTPDGRTRMLRPVIDLLSCPSLIPAVVRLGRRSARGMPIAAAHVAAIARAWNTQ